MLYEYVMVQKIQNVATTSSWTSETRGLCQADQTSSCPTFNVGPGQDQKPAMLDDVQQHLGGPNPQDAGVGDRKWK